MTIWTRVNTVLLLLVLFALFGVMGLLARGVRGGPLDPPGPVGSTMRTLDKLTPSWSVQLAADDSPSPDNCGSTRFECVFDGSAVLDKETGLVWQTAPSISTINTWAGARLACVSLVQGLRRGWHLPTIEELSTLLALPATAPFTGITATDEYWSSTTSPFDSTVALTRVIGTLAVGERPKDTSGVMRLWCVRGGATPGS